MSPTSQVCLDCGLEFRRHSAERLRGLGLDAPDDVQIWARS